ncbi:hypothetical protein LX36DRAFT_30133 [Colletotrichum falcatum]|nr:hypothetical protein LX36DRAFT_30133 [Colletotrichum falcatum]
MPEVTAYEYYVPMYDIPTAQSIASIASMFWAGRTVPGGDGFDATRGRVQILVALLLVVVRCRSMYAHAVLLELLMLIIYQGYCKVLWLGVYTAIDD